MAEGNDTYQVLAQPLNGHYEHFGTSTTLDMETKTRITGGTGDFIVYQDDGGEEKMWVESTGDVHIKAGSFLNLSSTFTTPVATGMTKGDLFLMFSTSKPVMGVCTSTAAQTIKYISPFDTKTINRASV